MWLFASNAFLSIVQDPSDTNTLIVRARREGDIETLFPDAEVIRRPERDYLFRAFISREVVAKAAADYVMGLTYTNFKNSVRDRDYHHACTSVWHTMADLQETPPYSGDGWPSRAPARTNRRINTKS